MVRGDFMETKEIILVLSLFIMSAAVEILIRRAYEIPKREGYVFKPINKTHRYIGMAIHTLFWVSFLFVRIESLFFIWIFSYALVIFSFRLYMEWKFEREKKQYLISINSFIWLLLVLTTIRISI